MRRRWGLVVAATALVAVGVGLVVHAATAPRATTAEDWRLVGRVPLSPREGAVVAAVGDSVVVYGGERYQECPAIAACPFPGYRRDGAVFDPHSNVWTAMAKAPRSVPTGPWAVDGHTLLVLTSHVPVRIAAYDVDANAWDVLPPPPVPLGANDVLAAGGGHAYVADDAVAGSGRLHRIERVDLSTGRWDLLPRSTNQPRMHLTALFVSPEGLLMAGLNPYQSGTPVQVEALEHGHWHRFPTPGLHAPSYTFAWTGTGLAAAFPSGGGSGQLLHPATSRWTGLAPQPELNDGSGWWEDSASVSGPLILKRGDVFDTDTGRSLRLTQPRGAGPGVSVGLVGSRAYVMDGSSHLWWQQV
jgi:hypothetical protein